LCGGIRPATTRDHVPPIALFDGAHRPDRLVVPACDECNRGTSTADLVASIVSRWRFESDEQEILDHRRLVARARKQASPCIEEWTKPGFIERKKGRQHLEKHGVSVPLGAGMVSIGPVTIRFLNLFAHKLVLGLYFEHFRESVPNTGRICAFWRTKEDFARHGVPQALLDIMTRYGRLQQGTWDTRKTFEYRFETNASEGLFGCLARLRGGLFVSGFAAREAAVITEGTDDWIRPSELLTVMHAPFFARRR